MEDYIAFMGGEVKALGDGRIGGYLVRFTGPGAPDLVGDYFDAETDFGEIRRSPVYYQHGLDPVLKTRKLGSADLRIDDFGVWADAQLNLRDEYERFVYGMAEAGKMGWSSGTAGHLIEVERVGPASHIKHWPLGLDASLTPTPAEPRNSATPIKQLTGQPLSVLAAELTAQVADAEVIGAAAEPQPIEEPGEQPQVRTEGRSFAAVRENTMSDVTSIEERLDASEIKMSQMSDALNRILAAIETEPANERAGYLTNYGGTADPNAKSFGDYLLAIMRKDFKRLTQVYKSFPVKDMAGDVGAQGGFMVPQEFGQPLLMGADTSSPIVSRCQRVPINGPSGTWPALDLSVAPTAASGQTAMAGGLSAATTEEGAALTEDQPQFKEIEWRLHKVGGYVEVSNELVADSPQAIEALLSALFRITINAKNERNVIRGTGSGEPLGIYNAACTIAVATAGNAVFAEADALALLSRHKNLSGKQSVWLVNQTVIPDFAAFADSSYNPMVHFVEGVRGSLLGLPIVYSEHVDSADANDVILADLGSYLWFQKGELEIAFSEHAAFTSDKGTWRFTQRNDGQPWLSAAITLADTASTTVSPFLYHDD